jgi:hypothetical protein
MAFSSSSCSARVTPVAADVIDVGALAARAAEVASRQRSPQTRRTYAAVYRSLVAFLGEHAVVDDLTPEAIRSYRMRSSTPTERPRRSPDGLSAQASSMAR